VRVEVRAEEPTVAAAEIADGLDIVEPVTAVEFDGVVVDYRRSWQPTPD
jgi:hypothetical protein